jgi:molecular chaperone GrpE (heat shock protein)
MDSTVSITEREVARPAHAALVEICRSRWELQRRVSALESEVDEQAAVARELREKIAKMDCQHRDLLKDIAKIVDDCDDMLQIESKRLIASQSEDLDGRQSSRCCRRLERTRASLMDRLTSQGVSVRNPVGKPNAELDRLHSTVETEAHEPGEIVKVLRTGLLWKGSVLRSSLVVVSAKRSVEVKGSDTATWDAQSA